LNTPQVIVFLVLLVVALTFFLTALTKKLRLLKLAAKENRFDRPGARLWNFITTVLLQKKMLKEFYGFIHLFIFWGFVFICLGEIPFMLEGVIAGLTVPILGTSAIFYLIKDVLSALVVLGLLIGMVRRWVIKPRHLYRSVEAALIVVMILGVILTDWLVGGAKVALGEGMPYRLAMVTRYFSTFYEGMPADAVTTLYSVMWWFHTCIILFFLAYIPNSKHMHLLAAPFNGYFASLQPMNRQIMPLDPLDESVKEYGVGRIENFTWKELLDCFSCGECGRCMKNCPANISGKPLNPKHLLSHTLKDHLLEKGAVLQKLGLNSTANLSEAELEGIAKKDPEAAAILRKNLIGDIFTQDELWACTTCGTCQTLCPVSNEHVNKIIGMRRYEVMEQDRYAPELRLAFRNVESKFNPWGVSWSERAAWAKEIDVPLLKDATEPEYLFWVGCAGSFDSRTQKVTLALARILQAAGVSFAILGREEKCCGDFARRAGNEYLFRLMAAENVALLQKYNVRKIITACPHCLNTLQNEYSEFGGEFAVIHHTQLILQLLKEGRLKLNETPAQALRLVYHDSCYLGRYAGEYEAPRELFRLLGAEVVEMERHHDRSFCCGAGGARMWMEEHLGERINNLRVDQALGKEPQALGVNCPYCLTMLEDGVKDRASEPVPVYDPAELIASRL
jgi:Fe-S oxidoreductase